MASHVNFTTAVSSVIAYLQRSVREKMVSEISFHWRDIMVFLSSCDEKVLVLLPIGARSFLLSPCS
jgi:hypothetical protein